MKGNTSKNIIKIDMKRHSRKRGIKKQSRHVTLDLISGLPFPHRRKAVPTASASLSV
jgi:hypothetical protein